MEVRMSRVIAVVQEKGGSGKTTAVVECAYQAGLRGRTVLVVDLDPQGNATSMLTGVTSHPKSIFDLFTDKDGKIPLVDVVTEALPAWPHVHVIPASGNMSTVDGLLGNRAGKERILLRILQPIRDKIDLILIDLGPAADFLTLNALVAADTYHVPAELSEYTLGGFQTVQELAEDVRASGANPNLKFGGVHLSGYHKGGSYGVRDLEVKLQLALSGEAVVVKVPHSSKVIESQAQHKPVGLIDPTGRVSEAYRTLTDRFLGP